MCPCIVIYFTIYAKRFLTQSSQLYKVDMSLVIIYNEENEALQVSASATGDRGKMPEV